MVMVMVMLLWWFIEEEGEEGGRCTVRYYVLPLLQLLLSLFVLLFRALI